MKIYIDTGNAAFEDGNWKTEVARILRELAANIENYARPEKLRDINGNTCGKVEY